MTEKDFGNQRKDQELTNKTPNPRLNDRGGIFMAEATTAEKPITRKEYREAESSAKEKLDRLHVARVRGERQYDFPQPAGSREEAALFAGGRPIEHELKILTDIEEIKREIGWKAPGDSDDDTKAKLELLNKGLIDKVLTRVDPYGDYVSKTLIAVMVDDGAYKALDYLMAKGIIAPMDSETTDYNRSFYGPMNASAVKEALKGKAHQIRKESDLETDKVEKVRMLKEAADLDARASVYEWMHTGAELVHTMNAKVVTGQIKEFVSISQAISPEYLDTLRSAKLVSTVMRLYEQEILRVRVRDGLVTSKNYAEITGEVINEKDQIIERREGGIERNLRLINESLPEEERLEDWELKWALYTGRNLFNISLRSSELVAQGNIQTSRAFPLESGARLIDQINLLIERFHIGKSQGGVHLTKLTKMRFHEDRKRRGWKETEITQILGRSRKEFEATGILDITGIFSGWRLLNMIYIENHNYDPENPNSSKLISLETYLNEDRYGKKGHRRDKPDTGSPEKLKKLFLTEVKDEEGNTKWELKKELSYSLGALLRLGQLLPEDKDTVKKNCNEIREAKRLIRAKIWERIAKENPLGVSLIMRGLRFNEGSTNPQHLMWNERLRQLDIFMYGRDTIARPGATAPSYLQDSKQWQLLQEKFTLANEKRLENIARSLSGKEVAKEDKSFEYIFNEVLQGLTDDEKALFEGDIQIGGKNLTGTAAEKILAIYQEISDLGQAISGELAEIRFPSIPIMNDLLYEHFYFGSAGAEFFKRRLGGDLPHMHEAQEKIMKVMTNPQELDPKEVLKTLEEAMTAIASPHGLELAQSCMYPIILSYLQFIQRGGEKFEDITTKEEKERGETRLKYHPILGWFKSQSIFSGVKQAANRPTSLAQVYGRKNSPSVDEFGMRDIINEVIHLGLTRTLVRDKDGNPEWPDTDNELRKKLRGKNYHWLLAFLRDLLWLNVVTAVKSFGETSAKDIEKN